MNGTGDAFTNPMTRQEALVAIFYLPVHISFLPTLLMVLFLKGRISEAELNFLVYAIGLSVMLMFEMGYMRRQFDPFCDSFAFCLKQILLSYVVMFLCNLAVNLTLGLFMEIGENPNNQSVMELGEAGYDGVMIAMAVFMAPIIEEIMFRGGIFGFLRQSSRVWAYIITTAVFSLYHVWAYLLLDWHYAVYLLQYIPVGILLCRLYEKTGSIWSCIFFHMLNNGIAIAVLSLFGEYI